MRKRNYTFLLFAFVIGLQKISGQTIESITENFHLSRDYKLIDHHIYVHLEKKPKEKNVYWRKNEFNLSEVHLRDDSTFVYFYVSKQRYDLTVGNYSINNKQFIFNWDSLKTYALAADSNLYNFYFRFKTPQPFKLIENRYTLEKGGISPQFENDELMGRKKIELFSSSRDILTNGKYFLPYSQFGYDLSGNKIFVESPHGKKNWFELDSIWGFALYTKNSINLYRVVKKGFNWYSLPGIKIVELSKIIIYTIGDGRTYSYFSENLESKIHTLTLDELRKVYKNNPSFLNLLNIEFGRGKPLNSANVLNTGYKVVEVYLNSLNSSN